MSGERVMPDKRLTINLAHVVHETIDGETIAIHLGNGSYYSLEGVAALVWAMIDQRAPRSLIAAAFEQRYPSAADQVATTVPVFLDELLEEDLVINDNSPGTDAPADSTVFVLPPRGDDEPFVAPVLHKYTDMQEFMLVDPLHDVEQDAGWPHVKAG